MSLSDFGISSISCTDLCLRAVSEAAGGAGPGLPGAQTLAALRSQESVGSGRGHSDGARSVSLETVQSVGPASHCLKLFTGKFLADNIVGSVLVFSLIFWIPFSILVHCVVSHHL